MSRVLRRDECAGQGVRQRARKRDGHRGLSSAARLVVLSELVAIETLAKLTWLKRSETISRTAFKKLKREFEADVTHVFRIAPIADATLVAARDLVDRYARTAAGPIDLVHLATLEYLQALYPPEPVRLMCSDNALRNVARARGVGVFDPEADELSSLDDSDT